MNRKRAGLFIGILILGIFGISTFVFTKPLGFISQGKRAPSRSADVSSLINEGKIALYNHDVLTAKAKFLEAVTTDPTSQEAQMLYGVTRVMAVYEEGQEKSTPGLDSIREIAELSGFTFSEYGVYNTVISKSPEQLATTTPKSGDILDFLNNKALKEINGAIENLNKVTSIDFVSVMNPDALKTTGPAYNIDYADALLIRAALYGAKASLELLLAYNLDIYIPQAAYGLQMEADELVALRNIILYYPKLLTPKEPARLGSSKSAFASSIDTYVSAIDRVRARGTATNHLFVLDVPLEQITNEPVQSTSAEQERMLQVLADVRASLDGVREWQNTFPDKPKEQRTFDLSKFFNSGAALNFRQMALTSDGRLYVTDDTAKGVAPYGLSQLINASTPEISQSQSGCYLGQSVILSGVGFSQKGSVTVSMLYPDGTGAPGVTMNADTLGQFNYVFTPASAKGEGVYRWRAKDNKTGVQTDYSRFPVTRYKKTWQTGSSGQGNGQFYTPLGIAAKGNEIFVADSGNHRIQVLYNNGAYVRMWGQYGSGPGEFINPWAISTRPSGNVYAIDYGNSRVQVFDAAGGFLEEFGSYGWEEGQFSNPMGVAVNTLEDVFVVDSGNTRIQKFGGDSSYLAWGQYGEGDGEFYWPTGIAIDSKNGVYILDSARGNVQKFDRNGNFLGKWTVSPAQGQFYSYLTGISVDTADNLLVSTIEGRILRFKSDGTFITEWRSYRSGNASQKIYGLAVDGYNSIYGTTDSAVVKFSPVSWNTLTVGKTGKGSGLAASTPLGINCGTFCSGSFTSDNTVTLVAIPDSGSAVAGWTGCDEVSGNTCLTSLSTAKSVKVQFDVVAVPKSPVLSSVSPSSGTVGTVVTLKGKYFGSAQGASTVSFNSVPVTAYTSWSETAIKCTVPAGATTGAVTVTTSVGTSPGKTFTVNLPVLSSISPSSGTVGAVVTLKGKYFGSAQGASTVSFNGVPVTAYTSWSETAIKCTVPAGATTGAVTVTTSVGTSPGKTFTVNLPVLSSVSPSSGTVGTVVTLKGKYFGSAQGASTVSFNGVAVTAYTSWSETAIKCTVPAGATTGAVTVTTSVGTSPGKVFKVKP